MAMMNYFGQGTVQNVTKFEEYLNNSLKFEPNLYLPIKAIKLGSSFFDSNNEIYSVVLNCILDFFQTNLYFITGFALYLIIYLYFFISIKFQ